MVLRVSAAYRCTNPSSQRWNRMRLISLRRARANTKVYAGALLMAGNLALAACKNPPPAFPPPAVTVASVVQRDVSDFAEFTRHFQTVNAVATRPSVSAYVPSIGFIEGDMVHERDVLSLFDPRPS